MEIKTERLTLRPISMEYLHSTHAYASDLENTRLMMFLPYESLAETESVVRRSVELWGMARPHHREFVILRDGEHIGGITLYFLDDPAEGELGWILHKKYWGRGYVTEAAKAMLEYAKNSCGIRRVIACCDSENLPSRRVMEKLGMTLAQTGARKNRSMGDAERVELIYELCL